MPSRIEFCRQLNEHQFKPRAQEPGLYCTVCGLIEPYPNLVQQKTVRQRSGPTPRASRRQKKAAEIVPVPQGDPHRKPWTHARKYGVTECFYSRQPFTEQQPPTFDHIVPVSQGGNQGHGVVLACQLCNSSRGQTPYEQYAAAVEAEHAAAEAEQRPYRRPKLRQTGDVWVLTTASNREWRRRPQN